MDTSTARIRRAEVAARIASAHGGVARHADLLQAGLSRSDVRTEIRAGRWARAGRHTVVIDGTQPRGPGRWWWAVWESGPGARLDGASALDAAGMTGYEQDRIDVTVPGSCRTHALPGVRIHRRREPGPLAGAGIPRERLEPATIHAAQWARTDRQAALLICLPVQQRLLPPSRLLATWQQVTRSPRRQFLDRAIRDVCDGAHALGELEFGRLCRRHGLPEPSRQVIRQLPTGRVYLDAEWMDLGLVVEIDGGHHAAALNHLDDCFRQNELALTRRLVLRAPLLAVRLYEERLMDQVVRAHRSRSVTCVMQFGSDLTQTA